MADKPSKAILVGLIVVVVAIVVATAVLTGMGGKDGTDGVLDRARIETWAANLLDNPKRIPWERPLSICGAPASSHQLSLSDGGSCAIGVPPGDGLRTLTITHGSQRLRIRVTPDPRSRIQAADDFEVPTDRPPPRAGEIDLSFDEYGATVTITCDQGDAGCVLTLE